MLEEEFHDIANLNTTIVTNYHPIDSDYEEQTADEFHSRIMEILWSILSQSKELETQHLEQAKANAEAMVVKVLEEQIKSIWEVWDTYDLEEMVKSYRVYELREAIERFQKKSQEGNTICDNLTTNE